MIIDSQNQLINIIQLWKVHVFLKLWSLDPDTWQLSYNPNFEMETGKIELSIIRREEMETGKNV